MHIEHAALYVTDLEEARYFFEHFLGAKAGSLYHNPKSNFKSYFMSFDEGARLEIMTRPELTGHMRQEFDLGYAHLAFSVGSKERVDLLTKELVDAGYSCSSGPRTTGDGYYESVIVALEGNLIEITV